MLELKNVSKVYKSGTIGIKDISFSVKKGEVVGLIGQNGAGKSTILNCITKSLFLSEGEISYNSQNINSHDHILNDVGILKEAAFYQHLSAYENVKFFLKIHNKMAYMSEIDSVLDFVGLLKKKDNKPSTYSFGMKQRLGLAMCLVIQPKLIILDEPFVGLDHNGKKTLLKKLKEWAEVRKTMILISSHQFTELEDLCTRYIVIKNGRIAFDGIPDNTKELHIKLDRTYENLNNAVSMVNEHTVKTSLEGLELDHFIRDITSEYKILNIIEKNQTLTNYFEEQN